MELLSKKGIPEAMPATPQKKISLADRLRTILKIPKSIQREVEDHEKMGKFKPVDEFNADSRNMPPIQRKKSNSLSLSLAASTLVALGLTHKPQIEEGVRYADVLLDEGIEMGKRAINEISFSRSGALAQGKHGSSRYDQVAAALREGVGSGANEEGDSRVFNEMDQYKYNLIRGNRPDFGGLFLELEYAHGNISEEQKNEAIEKLNAQIDEAKNSLTEEELKNPIRVTHKLAEQRKLYVRGRADVYSMIVDERGNCEALVRYLLATVPKVVVGNIEMAVQVYTDHVRFLVRKQGGNTPNNPWYWVDGHEWGELTVEDIQGTTIVSAESVLKVKMGVEKRKTFSNKPENPENNFGYHTNSMLEWNAADGRTATRNSSEGNVPLIQKEESRPFAESVRVKKPVVDKGLRYIEVAPEFFQKAEADKDVSEQKDKVAKKISLEPHEVIDAAKSGYYYGAANDLGLLAGVNLNSFTYSRPVSGEISDKYDLSPLKDSQLEKLNITSLGSTDLVGVNTLQVEHIKIIEVNAAQTSLLQKVAKNSLVLEHVAVKQDNPMTQEETLASMLRGPQSDIFGLRANLLRISETMMKNKKGDIQLTIDSPFESLSNNWNFDAKHGRWQSDFVDKNGKPDFISPDVRAGVESIATRGELEIIYRVNDLAYLKYASVDYSQIKSVRFPEAYFSAVDERGDDKALEIKIGDALEKAVNLKTIYIEMRDDTSFSGVFDLSSLKDVACEEIVFILPAPLSPEESLNVSGVSKSITIRSVVADTNIARK